MYLARPAEHLGIDSILFCLFFSPLNVILQLPPILELIQAFYYQIASSKNTRPAPLRLRLLLLLLLRRLLLHAASVVTPYLKMKLKVETNNK